ncbi:glycosyltransferase [Providencia rustigianii]|uniref:glycosyltransferase n=1 Tax=Providencia rustigianii TaxID=158850 RepID=UPI000F70D4C6|nr:glycosyltransferase [Providencia rustigianii]MTC60659.1 glycosyltransferase [Providencia rustigianii]VEH57126.1 Glycogen synthase [Providencia rustigianii]
MKKIAIIIPTLTIGGGEKVAIQNANDLIASGYDVSLIVPKGNIEYKIDSSITLYSGKSKNLLSDLFFCKKMIKKVNPDTVISYMERANFINLIVYRKSPYEKIVSIHTVPSIAYKKRNYLNRIFIFITMYLIKKRSIPVITISKGISKELTKFYGIKKIFLIENYFTPPAVDNNNEIDSEIDSENISFAFVGRLDHIKGCDVFIEAIALSIKNNPSSKFDFWIIGDGEQKPYLLKLCENYNLESRVHFLGSRNDIPELLNRIDYLIIPSYVEGFGLVVLEGLYYGCSIIYSKCKYGPQEILGEAYDIDDSYSFSDPSENKSYAIYELSEIINSIQTKRDNSKLNIKRKYVISNYNKTSSISKLKKLIGDDF